MSSRHQVPMHNVIKTSKHQGIKVSSQHVIEASSIKSTRHQDSKSPSQHVTETSIHQVIKATCDQDIKLQVNMSSRHHVSTQYVIKKINNGK